MYSYFLQGNHFLQGNYKIQFKTYKKFKTYKGIKSKINENRYTRTKESDEKNQTKRITYSQDFQPKEHIIQTKTLKNIIFIRARQLKPNLEI